MARSMGLQNRKVLLSALISFAMIIATILAVAPRSEAALGLNNFEIGTPPEVDLTVSADPDADIVNANGGTDWMSLPLVSGSFDEGEVKVINDQNYEFAQVVTNPATAAAQCNVDGPDEGTGVSELITTNGTKIDDYPFVPVAGSPSPPKNDICQVYLAYVVESGDTILYMGVVRRGVTGTTAVALELNRINQANRADGDLLVTFEFDGSGPVSDLTVRQWDGPNQEWDVQTLSGGNWDGTSWEHFGEVAVNLSDTSLLPPPTTVDDCASFSSVLPYGFAGNDDNSNVGDWGGETPLDIPRCGEIQITKVATPSADASYIFEWEITDNAQNLDPASGEIVDGETVSVDVVAGEYTLDEIVEASPYELLEPDGIVCDGGVDPNAITVGIGDTVSCTIYNVASAVQVVKSGAGDDQALFAFEVTDQTGFSLGLGDSSDLFLYEPGTSVTITETLPGGLPSWDLTAITCVDSEGAIQTSVDLSEGSVTFDTIAGEQITCTFVNEQEAEITVVKEVVNDNGGTAGSDDFQLYLNESPVDSGDPNHVPAGEYEVTEDLSEGYEQTSISCEDSQGPVDHPVDLSEGQSVTCTVINDDIAPGLTVVKNVINDDGGTAVAADFQLYVNDVPVEQGVAVEFPANTPLEVSEDLLDGYAQTGLVCVDNEAPSGTVTHPVTLTPGQSVTCTITNDDRTRPQVTVVKATDPTSSDLFSFTLNPGDSQQVPGNNGSYTWESLAPGTYELTEGSSVDWLLERVTCDLESTSIPNGASFTLDWEEHITCVFSNGELGSITVVKATNVSTTDLFPISISSTGLNETVQLGDGGQKSWMSLIPGTYTVSESIQGLNWDISLSCNGEASVGEMVDTSSGSSREAQVQLGLRDHVTCVFVNSAAPADLQVTKIDVVDPIVLSDESPVGQIQYTIEVSNLGPAQAHNVTVTDNLPATVDFVSATIEVGSCSHASGVVTCSIGTLPVGESVTLTIVVSTEEFGSITVFSPVNVVEVASSSPDPVPGNNQDNEVTELTEVLAEVILPFTGFFGFVWLYIALALMATGSTLLVATRRSGRHARKAMPIAWMAGLLSQRD